MGLISKTKTWADNENVTYTDINSNFDVAYNELNGALDNANLKAGAAIAESKIAFDSSAGHSHNGTDSMAIPKGFAFPITGTLSTGTSMTSQLIAIGTQTITKVYANVKTAPDGAAIIVDINKNGTSIWNTTQANRITIADGATTGTETSIDITSLVEGDILTIDVDQVGTSQPGLDLLITVKA